MTFSIFTLAAAAAAQAAVPQHGVDHSQARAAGYAQAQQALSGAGVPVSAASPLPVAAPLPGFRARCGRPLSSGASTPTSAGMVRLAPGRAGVRCGVRGVQVGFLTGSIGFTYRSAQEPA